jgi:hypothetical protein
MNAELLNEYRDPGGGGSTRAAGAGAAGDSSGGGSARGAAFVGGFDGADPLEDADLTGFGDGNDEEAEAEAMREILEKGTTVVAADGTKTTTLVGEDGTVTELIENSDGTVTRVVKNKDGTLTKVVTNKDGTRTKIVTDASGKTITLKKNADGSVTKTVIGADGVAVEVTLKTNADGSQTVVTRTTNADGTVTEQAEEITADGVHKPPSKRMSAVNADGSTTTIVENADGSKVEIIRNLDGTTMEVRVNADGTKTISKMTVNADGTVKREITKINADGTTAEIIVETQTLAADGTATVVTETTKINKDGTKAVETTSKTMSEVEMRRQMDTRLAESALGGALSSANATAIAQLSSARGSWLDSARGSSIAFGSSRRGSFLTDASSDKMQVGTLPGFTFDFGGTADGGSAASSSGRRGRAPPQASKRGFAVPRPVSGRGPAAGRGGREWSAASSTAFSSSYSPMSASARPATSTGYLNARDSNTRLTMSQGGGSTSLRMQRHRKMAAQKQSRRQSRRQFGSRSEEQRPATSPSRSTSGGRGFGGNFDDTTFGLEGSCERRPSPVKAKTTMESSPRNLVLDELEYSRMEHLQLDPIAAMTLASPQHQQQAAEEEEAASYQHPGDGRVVSPVHVVPSVGAVEGGGSTAGRKSLADDEQQQQRWQQHQGALQPGAAALSPLSWKSEKDCLPSPSLLSAGVGMNPQALPPLSPGGAGVSQVQAQEDWEEEGRQRLQYSHSLPQMLPLDSSRGEEMSRSGSFGSVHLSESSSFTRVPSGSGGGLGGAYMGKVAASRGSRGNLDSSGSGYGGGRTSPPVQYGQQYGGGGGSSSPESPKAAMVSTRRARDGALNTLMSSLGKKWEDGSSSTGSSTSSGGGRVQQRGGSGLRGTSKRGLQQRQQRQRPTTPNQKPKPARSWPSEDHHSFQIVF